jgi:hypothetical protein
MVTKEVRDSKKVRPLYEIAHEIYKSWGSKMYFGAKPYVSAMMSLDKITAKYYLDGADMIVRYFLANASAWRGEDAKRIKAELRSMLK